MKSVLALLLLLFPAIAAADNQKYAWDDSWPRFRTSEYVVTGLTLAGAAANYYLVPPPKSAVWRGDVLFDKSARNTLEILSERDRNRANTLSDLLAFPLIGYSMLDGPITAGLVGGNKDTAFQLAMINAETFAVTEFLNLSITNALPRSRPPGAVCDVRSKYDPYCVKSFWSGHEANVVAAASLLCTEHGVLGLYGGKADAVVCGTSLVAAAAVGVLRVSSNNHRASDVLVGAAVGAATGYLMPNLLHFKSGRPRNRLGYLIPNVNPHGGGLTYVKAW